MASHTLSRAAIFAFSALLLCPTLLGAPSKDLLRKISDAARRASLDPKLVEAVVKVESNFKPDATSSKGAMGLMQVMSKTAKECQIQTPYHSVNNLMGACDCLRKLINRYEGNLRFALAAYNAGPKNVDHYHGIPPFGETQRYVEKIMTLYQELRAH